MFSLEEVAFVDLLPSSFVLDGKTNVCLPDLKQHLQTMQEHLLLIYQGNIDFERKREKAVEDWVVREGNWQ